MKIVLASESPFRRRALDMLGLEYEVSPSRIDEKAIRDENPLELTRKIAEAKARRSPVTIQMPSSSLATPWLQKEAEFSRSR